MGKRVADQHAVMDRGWQVADELAAATRALLNAYPSLAMHVFQPVEEALRRYEEARNG